MPEKGILLFEAAWQSPGWEWRHSSERYSQTDGRKTNEYEKGFKNIGGCIDALSAMYIKSMTKEQSAHELLLLNNIEALASGEDNNLDKADYYCYGRGNIDCPISGEKVNTVIKVYSLD